jgi:hypothetical protein
VRIFGDHVAIPPDAGAASWIEPRLGRFGSVSGLVPSGYAGQVVVFDPPVVGPDHRGDLRDAVATLASVAARHTTTPDAAWFAIWHGYGWTSGRVMSSTSSTSWLERRRIEKDQERRSRTLAEELALVPTFELPQREHYVLSGPVEAAARIRSPGDRYEQLPDLWWPEDRAWFVATDTDLAWTYVAGTDELLADVTAAFPGRTAPVDRDATNFAVGEGR